MLSPHEKHNFRHGVTCTDVFFIQHKNKLNIHYWNDMCNVYTLRNRKIYISNMKLILIHILLFLAKKKTTKHAKQSTSDWTDWTRGIIGLRAVWHS